MIIYFFVLAIVPVVLAFIYQLSRNVVFGWCSLLLVSLYNYTFGMQQLPFGGLHLSVLDGVMMCILIAGIVRTLPRLKERNSSRLIGAGYLFLFALSYARGILVNGFPAASNECRGYAGALVGILYFLTVPPESKIIQRFVNIYLLYGSALVLVAILAYSGLPVGSTAWVGQADADNAINGRLLPSAAAAALAVCFLLSLGKSYYGRRTLWTAGLPVPFLAMSIYLRHRTIWAMLVLTILSLVVFERKILKRLIPIGMAVVLIVGSLIVFFPSVEGAGANKFEDAAQNESTLAWRVNSWLELVWDEDQTLVSAVIGKEMGAGYWRFNTANGLYVNVPAHNEYVAEYLRVGVVGVFFLVWYMFRPIKGLWRQRGIDNLSLFPSSGIWIVVLVGTFTYGMTYGLEADLYALVAVANAASVAERYRKSDRPPPSDEVLLPERESELLHA